MEPIIIGSFCGFSLALLALSYIKYGRPDHFKWTPRSREENSRRAYSYRSPKD